MGQLLEIIVRCIISFFETSFSLLLVVWGGLLLLGVLFRWKWVCAPKEEEADGWKGRIYRSLGEGGYRVALGAFGLLLMGIGVLCWLL